MVEYNLGRSCGDDDNDDDEEGPLALVNVLSVSVSVTPLILPSAWSTSTVIILAVTAVNGR